MTTLETNPIRKKFIFVKNTLKFNKITIFRLTDMEVRLCFVNIKMLETIMLEKL